MSLWRKRRIKMQYDMKKLEKEYKKKTKNAENILTQFEDYKM